VTLSRPGAFRRSPGGTRWIDDAVEQLSKMMYTCSLDVVRDCPNGLAESSVAFLLGV
jgi:hypothetical protein